MSAIGRALGFSMDAGEAPREKRMGMSEGDIGSIAGDTEDDTGPESKSPDSEGSEKPKATAETLAMKQFERASTTEAKVAAMKDFLEACGMTSAGSDY